MRKIYLRTKIVHIWRKLYVNDKESHSAKKQKTERLQYLHLNRFLLLNLFFSKKFIVRASSIKKSLRDQPILTSTPKPRDVIIDVRHPAEVADMPLNCHPDNEVKCIPFFHLSEKSVDLDPQASYLIYCEKGVMSRLHAAILRDRGFHNVGILAYSAD
ncbi:MAG: tRNA sulfurtransferase [Porticoccaceae bacterium UBA1117]|nr:MAG: tRNA sulfurtransferase [Porticoccaceae bacterium UBA1117]